MSEWKKVRGSTAPVGEAVLAYTASGEVRIARYRDGGAWITVPGGWHIYPTHWMPLPAPPV